MIRQSDLAHVMDRYGYGEETRAIVARENLLPWGLLSRLHASYPQHSGIMESSEFLFRGKERYAGLEGFREIVALLKQHGVDIGHIKERELFIDVYRFLATKHVLNKINWQDFATDSLFQLVFPQPGMVAREVVDAYTAAATEEERQRVVRDHLTRTNPHDGKQLLNKPWYEDEHGEMQVLEGSQHKYPPCQLIFDASTQDCFTFCTYCFRHAQVRGDEDMFVQRDIGQVHAYLRKHPEVSDVLITGGDAGYLQFERLEQYARSFIEDPALRHIRTLRMGSRVLTYHPEMMLVERYDRYLKLFEELADNGVQVVLMSHFSTPREVLNPSTIAAIRRLRRHGVVVKSQSPIMRHISMFEGDDGRIDVERSAQNWIDLGNVLAMLSVGFHSMYCARPTGEHHYFTAPLADVNRVFSLVYRSLASINRPSRYITMTSSAGKISLLGEAEVNGDRVFVLKFNEGRNMEWIDRVYLAKYDEHQDTIEKLEPYGCERYFFEEELQRIEENLDAALRKRMHRGDAK